jgi:hypothetical protein
MNIKQVALTGLLISFAENALAAGANNSYVAQPRPVYQTAPVYVQPRQQPAVVPAPSSQPASQNGCSDAYGRPIQCQQNQQQSKPAVPVQRNVAPLERPTPSVQVARPTVSSQQSKQGLNNLTGVSSHNATLEPTKPSQLQKANQTSAPEGNSTLSRPTIKAGIKSALGEINKLTPVLTSIGSLKEDVKSGNVSQVPQSINDTREATTRYLEQKMPTTDSWLYKKTNFVDNPAVQKIVKVDQRTLDEVGKVAPVTTSAGTLSRDAFSGRIDKLPGDIKDSRQAMTDYFAQKMPSTNSVLYKSTNLVDNPKMQSIVKVDQRVLTAIENF